MDTPSTSKYAFPPKESTIVNKTRGGIKFLDDDTYEKVSRNLFATAKACHESNCDEKTTANKIIDTFHAELVKIKEIVDKKIPKK